MSAFFNEDRLRVESIGETVTIPNNDIARLMYYLSCVDTVISYDEDILSDYQHYYLLTPNQKEVLIKLVEIFKPQIFIAAGIFILDQSLIPEGFNNEFYKITDQRIGIHINQEIMIGGRYVRVLKVMACDITWLNKYYYTPLKNIYEMKDFMNFFSKALLAALNDYDYDNNYSNNYRNNNYKPYSNNLPNNNSNNYSNNYNNNNRNNYSNSYSYINKYKKKEEGCCCLIW